MLKKLAFMFWAFYTFPWCIHFCEIQSGGLARQLSGLRAEPDFSSEDGVFHHGCIHLVYSGAVSSFGKRVQNHVFPSGALLCSIRLFCQFLQCAALFYRGAGESSCEALSCGSERCSVRSWHISLCGCPGDAAAC